MYVFSRERKDEFKENLARWRPVSGPQCPETVSLEISTFVMEARLSTNYKPDFFKIKFFIFLSCKCDLRNKMHLIVIKGLF